MATQPQRILTTHAGSLPRPPGLTALHLRRSQGEAVDESELARAADEAAGEVLARQLATGLDVVNDGEMGRESFFTYVRHRMSGFSGQSERPGMADILRHPGFRDIECRRARGGYPVADDVMANGLLVACHHALEEADVDRIHEVMEAFLASR